MKNLKDYIIAKQYIESFNEEWRNDLNDGDEEYHHIIQESEYINPLCLESNIGTSYIKHIMNIYERLGESIFREKELKKHPDIRFIKILKNDETGYSPEAPSARVYFDDKDTREWIVNKCKFMNYYCSKEKETKNKDSLLGELFVQISPNKPRECSQKIIDESGGLVIHLTSEAGFKKIMKEGIVPKTPSKDIRPEQIYFISPTNECIKTLKELCLDLSSNKIERNEIRRRKTEKKVIEHKKYSEKLIKWLSESEYFDDVKYAILFNINKLKKNRKINFYEDTTTPGYPAYWTAEYIPASCIIGCQYLDI